MDLTAVLSLLDRPQFRYSFLIGLVVATILIWFPRLNSDWAMVVTGTAFVAAPIAGALPVASLVDGLLSAAWVPAVTAICVLSAAGGAKAAGRRKWFGIAWAMSIGGLWLTVPDTEGISLLMGAAAALLWTFWPLDVTHTGRTGTAVLALAAAMSAATGAATRPAALLSGMGCVAALGAIGYGNGSDDHNRRPMQWIRLGGHLVLILIWARVAGRADDALQAAAIGGGATALTMLVHRFLLSDVGRKSVAAAPTSTV